MSKHKNVLVFETSTFCGNRYMGNISIAKQRNTRLRELSEHSGRWITSAFEARVRN